MFDLFIRETTTINEELIFMELIATYKLKLIFLFLTLVDFLTILHLFYFIKVNLSIKTIEVTAGGTFHLYSICLHI